MTDPFEQAAQALSRDPAIAEKLARGLMVQSPRDPRPQLIRASALRRLGRAAEALPLLTSLVRDFPRAARTRYELGLCLTTTGNGDGGCEQLKEAVRLDPNLTEGWQALADAAFAVGDAASEKQAQAALARLSTHDPQLGLAAEAVVNGRHAEAEPLLRQHLLTHPRDAEAARLLAACYVAARAFENAETLLRHALEIRPEFAQARFDLAHALFARKQGEAALIELAPLEDRDPTNPAYRNLRAGCLALLGDDAEAETIHAELSEQFPANPQIAINHGHALRTQRLRDAAIASYRRALKLRPQTGEAWWSLANLKVDTVLTATDEAAMLALNADTNLPDKDRMHVAYALGRRYEDAGQPGPAFTHYATGAALAKRQFAPQAEDYEAQAEAVANFYTSEFYAARAGWGSDSEAPIFILGLPRSGSTLVEQILASHPLIEGTMELPYIGGIAAHIAARGPDTLENAGPDEVRMWSKEYLARAQIHRRLGRPHFIDKMPNNFRHIGLIRLILPRAKIIDVRRAPMAACFSCFKQLFAEGQEFSYDLTDLGHYYRHYLLIVRHFDAVAPGAIHTLIYEDLVDETEVRVRQLLRACGLDFDPACLRFFENKRAVRTVSSEQVRQPIYRSGLDQWQTFAPWLGELEDALGNAMNGWRT